MSTLLTDGMESDGHYYKSKLQFGVFFIELLLTISALYSARINLVQKRISAIGFDALVLLLFSKKKAQMIRENSRLITRMGIISLLVAVGGLSEVISILQERILPHIR